MTKLLIRERVCAGGCAYVTDHVLVTSPSHFDFTLSCSSSCASDALILPLDAAYPRTEGKHLIANVLFFLFSLTSSSSS